MQSNWAPAHSKALCEYFDMGMSFSAIAEAINAKFRTSYSRNAVLGRATRMALAGASQSHGGTTSPSITGPSITETSRLRRIHERANSRPWRPRPILAATETAPLRCADVVPRHLSLLELECDDCRYPYGGDEEGETITFCGHPRHPGSSYCAAHFDLSVGPGTASERAADRILLTIVERHERSTASSLAQSFFEYPSF